MEENENEMKDEKKTELKLKGFRFKCLLRYTESEGSFFN